MTDGSQDRSAEPGYPNFEDLLTTQFVPLEMLEDDPFQVRDHVDRSVVARIAETLSFGLGVDVSTIEDRDLSQKLKYPLRIRLGPEGQVYVLGGSQRKAALLLAGWDRAPCRVVLGELTEADVIDDQIIDNQMRAGLPPANLGDRYQRSMELHQFNTQQELATHYGLELAHVNQHLSLVELPEPVKSQINLKRIVLSDALLLVQLLRYAKDPDLVTETALQVASRALKHRDLRDLVREYMPERQARKSKKTSPKEPPSKTVGPQPSKNGSRAPTGKTRVQKLNEAISSRQATQALDDMGAEESTIFDSPNASKTRAPSTPSTEQMFEVRVAEKDIVVLVDGDNLEPEVVAAALKEALAQATAGCSA